MKKAVTIGTFDGVHRGHKLVLETLKKEASKRGLQPVAMTFDRHPLELIAPDRAPGNLMTTVRKTAMIRQEGVEPIVLAFTEQLRGMRVYEWLDYIHRKYDVELLVAGYDNTFGSDGIDLSISDYKDIGTTVGVEVISAPEEAGVSSSAIRKAVRRGDIPAAIRMLGHLPELEGKVIQGFHIGRELGFPTANLQAAPGTVIPPVGVYAATAYIGDEKSGCPAMVNIGRRPTFEGTVNESERISVETHIIGKDEDLYGKNIRLEFIERLRDEMKFGSTDDLKRQLNEDKAQVLAIKSK
ncbi:MAG: riboflavin biosynthesis protein RibF [Muribaculaceae bacterium]|nr:riboflavin biosynthesis protein RibF [Muribaculaceae bacterium]